MEEMNQWFPYIQVKDRKNGYEGSAAIKVKSIIHRNLLPKTDSVEPVGFDFLGALHGLQGLVLELHVIVIPHLEQQSNSQIRIGIFIRAAGATKEAVCTKLVNGYLLLNPLLGAHYPEAEWVPVKTESEYTELYEPFYSKSAIMLSRKREVLELRKPFKKAAIGFTGPLKSEELPPLCVEHIYPNLPSQEDWSRLLKVMVRRLDPIKIVIRLKPTNMSSRTRDRLLATINSCDIFLTSHEEHLPTVEMQAKAIRDISLRQLYALQGSAFDLGTYVLAPCSLDLSFGHVVGKFCFSPQSDSGQSTLFTNVYEIQRIGPQKAQRVESFSEQGQVTAEEAANCFRLPSSPVEEIIGFPIKYHRTSLAVIPGRQMEQERAALHMFTNAHQIVEQEVYFDLKDRFNHCFIVGQTGTGKSMLMGHMVMQDILAGRGLALIDPHGDLVDEIIGKIPEHRIEDVILFDLLDTEFPVGFNLLEWKTLEERDLLIDELYLSIDALYDLRECGGPIFEKNFRGMLGALMGDGTRKNFVATLLDFVPCYQRAGFRSWLKHNLSDKELIEFLGELEKLSGEHHLNNLSPYVTSKFSRFTSDRLLKRIIGQIETRFNIDDILAREQIFLVKLGKGRFGATVSALIANQLVSRFKMAAMKRGNMAEAYRTPYFLYVDEAHNLPADNFTELLSEARKYKLGLCLATQYTAQLKDRNNPKRDLLAAISGNVGTTISFRLGLEDASALAPLFYPRFTEHDIVGLPNWQGYASMKFGKQGSPPFSFYTRKSTTPANKAVAERVINLSRVMYGRPAALVDKEITNRERPSINI